MSFKCKVANLYRTSCSQASVTVRDGELMSFFNLYFSCSTSIIFSNYWGRL